jgi:RNA polymerase sigma-70 factor (ECF subfamily)
LTWRTISPPFERLLARWTRVEDPRAYLYVIATNRVRDHWRRQKRDRELTNRLRPSKEDSTTLPVDPWLRDLVMRLPDRLRRPVLLHYYADLPVAEVAKALHRPVGTIKRALSEGRAHLLNDIEEQQ